MKRAPAPGELSTTIVPPWAATSARAMASPSPTLPPPCRPCPVEPLEEMPTDLFVHPLAFVPYPQPHRRRRPRSATTQGDRLPRARMRHRVLHQIEEDLGEPILVRLHVPPGVRRSSTPDPRGGAPAAREVRKRSSVMGSVRRKSVRPALARVSRSAIRRSIRRAPRSRACSCFTRSASGAASRSRTCRCPLTMVSGVRSSWETSETNCSCAGKRVSMRSSIPSMVSASSPISSLGPR